ncbi:MAG: glycosyltransferase family A protein [Bryobacteraceae bacterium]
MNFVLVTPARNEELLIGKTMESVVGQSVLPVRWVVVDDGSTDRTAEIVERYARRHDWIELLRRPPRRERSFAGKVFAFNAGFDRLQSLEFQLIANLDADVLLEPDHFEFLIQRFAEDPALGVAGTAYVQGGSDSTRDSFEGEESVAVLSSFFARNAFNKSAVSFQTTAVESIGSQSRRRG